jgi:cytoskeletal protein CcmA (bactofilin family)
VASRAPESTPVTEPPGAKLVVGPGVKLRGAEIQDCDMLLVEGRVEATMDSRLIQIADQGSFDGTVNIDVAEIRGRFSGELTAREHLIIHSTGRVSGKIRYGKIVVHEGGELSGDVKSLSATESANSPTLPKPAESVAAKVEDLTATAMSRLLAAKSA